MISTAVVVILPIVFIFFVQINELLVEEKLLHSLILVLFWVFTKILFIGMGDGLRHPRVHQVVFILMCVYNVLPKMQVSLDLLYDVFSLHDISEQLLHNVIDGKGNQFDSSLLLYFLLLSKLLTLHLLSNLIEINQVGHIWF